MKHIVLAGGGTAGHVNPLLSVAAAIGRLEPDAKVSVIGTAVGLEKDLVPAAGFELDTIEKVPFPRRPNLYMLKFPGKWAAETRKVRTILEEREADVVAGFGGYASAPVYATAHRMGLPIVIHEQNARAGMANKLGSRWAEFIGTVYDGTGLKPASDGSIERVGLPLRPAIADLVTKLETDRAAARAEAAAELGVDPNRPLVLVTGGSLGAVSLNRAVAAASADLLKVAQVVHLTGRGKSDEVRSLVDVNAGAEHLTGLGPDDAGRGDYHVAEYLERIDLAFACADLVVCRSGAGTVAELTALGLPAVYVPLPIGNGEQRFNAQPVVEAHGGIMVADKDLTPTWVREEVTTLLDDPEQLHDMGAHAWQYGIRDAAETMARRILDLA
ncbi:UDP-diphospho-muramoylpentapeptide beta-N-acetylglucosaminyltransferase [Bifidobacterium sp. UTCIF-37]|uniref:UDP-N-acetylglucosamine--N-acetylmuramyl-(pentapeptide) pyrophosphoryl-undecaprenol N-acetylglucosamine transferase n=1 Tax=Bifidobacterium callitrichos TaxID=762209 RepID=A0A5M9ZAX2_9BIFI|nr:MULTISPECIES: UDP-N-acetylglucosamine--N-acetylmuramyl-(pentapeptide) pyrophosphoryl-undecaprenol N-acetylglucosamine transferase [Bifidobacterium]KAA8815755.1 UDP-N-acetylglucosamine--N-acetylmuramyl-(pentapeptide) pyrophosphoryl-undecaprenol N-acetylglucosamine transferase [Bifidobacterium callitrichos]TPF87137.1 UDP-diphospho-muramoylpentapeptide beta-N-acetylglucosaminyltransferase [Bifidobacterium sp. UTCIF-37]TPF91242.1 UDP-diphospho-muramoylpentapeptide beta-N-acetylglucosaminyltransfe